MRVTFSRAVMFAAVLAVAVPALLWAADKDQKTTVFLPNEIEWVDAEAPFLPGTKIAVLEGDPSKPGTFVYRMKMPDGYKSAPHAHKKPERVTVISGEYHAGLGDKFDPKETQALPPGSYIIRPPGTMHFAWCKGETVVQIHGEGPWAAEYANPADDPKKRR